MSIEVMPVPPSPVARVKADTAVPIGDDATVEWHSTKQIVMRDMKGTVKLVVKPAAFAALMLWAGEHYAEIFKDGG